MYTRLIIETDGMNIEIISIVQKFTIENAEFFPAVESGDKFDGELSLVIDDKISELVRYTRSILPAIYDVLHEYAQLLSKYYKHLSLSLSNSIAAPVTAMPVPATIEPAGSSEASTTDLELKTPAKSAYHTPPSKPKESKTLQDHSSDLTSPQAEAKHSFHRVMSIRIKRAKGILMGKGIIYYTVSVLKYLIWIYLYRRYYRAYVA